MPFNRWKKLGLLLTPQPQYPWLATHAASAFGLPVSESKLKVYVSGRDSDNRSRIGCITFEMDPKANKPKLVEILEEPVIPLGPSDSFYQDGTSYPCMVPHKNHLWMYFTGWRRGSGPPFQNELGLALSKNENTFAVHSEKPLFQDQLSTGSVFVLKENSQWKMWYTSFLKWGKNPQEPKHEYLIKYATSPDGIIWNRDNITCIPFENPTEHSIARPSVLVWKGQYHMWYCMRGEHYKIGYAQSKNGFQWKRHDQEVVLEGQSQEWDRKEQSYPHVFFWRNKLWMLYCGNEYGRTGLGIAVSELEI